MNEIPATDHAVVMETPLPRDRWRRWGVRVFYTLAFFYVIQWGACKYVASLNLETLDHLFSSVKASTLRELAMQSRDSKSEHLDAVGKREMTSNAWPLYIAAMGSFDDELCKEFCGSFIESNKGEESTPLSENKDKFERFEKQCDEAHLLINMASSRPVCFPDIRWEDEANMTLPHLSKIRCLVKGFMYSADINLERGHAEKAEERIMDALKILSRGVNEPILVSHFVRIACYAIVFDHLDRSQGYSEDALVRMVRELDQVHLDKDLVVTMAGECFYGLSSYTSLSVSYSWIPLLPLWVELDKREYLRVMLPLIQGREPSFSGWDARLEQVAPWGYLTKFFISSLENCALSTQAIQAKLEKVRRMLVPHEGGGHSH